MGELMKTERSPGGNLCNLFAAILKMRVVHSNTQQLATMNLRQLRNKDIITATMKKMMKNPARIKKLILKIVNMKGLSSFKRTYCARSKSIWQYPKLGYYSTANQQ